MIRPLPPEVERVLTEGSFCHLAAATPRGPHLTPLVFVVHASRVWVTTSRSSAKARAWRRDSRVGGLVRGNGRAVSFGGTVRTHDLLDPHTWARSVRSAPTVSVASLLFTRKNARFFAGYAVDAHRVPLAWTPPGRVFAEIQLERVAVLDVSALDAAEMGVPGGEIAVAGTWGGFGSRVASRSAFRAAHRGGAPLRGVPAEVRERIGESGAATLAVGTGAGPVVLPVRRITHLGATYAVSPSPILALVGSGPEFPTALTADHASSWRARAMTGVMLQGRGTVFVPERLRSGASSASALVRRAGLEARAALVRIDPARVVWWKGWTSGTVGPR